MLILPYIRMDGGMELDLADGTVDIPTPTVLEVWIGC